MRRTIAQDCKPLRCGVQEGGGEEAEGKQGGSRGGKHSARRKQGGSMERGGDHPFRPRAVGARRAGFTVTHSRAVGQGRAGATLPVFPAEAGTKNDQAAGGLGDDRAVSPAGRVIRRICLLLASYPGLHPPPSNFSPQASLDSIGPPSRGGSIEHRVRLVAENTLSCETSAEDR